MTDIRGGPSPGEAGYVAFVEAAWPRYLGIARLLTGDPHRAEELLQDCLVELYPRWRRVAGRGDPHAYLRRMLVNGNVSLWRRARRERLVAEPPDGADPQGARADPDRALQRALALLPRRQRAVIVLRYYADLSEKDVAAALGCAVGTVKIHNARAVARLRELLPRPEYRREGVAR